MGAHACDAQVVASNMHAVSTADICPPDRFVEMRGLLDPMALHCSAVGMHGVCDDGQRQTVVIAIGRMERDTVGGLWRIFAAQEQEGQMRVVLDVVRDS